MLQVSYWPIDGVIGQRLVDSQRFWVLRFRLMVKRGHRVTGPKHQKEKRSMEHFAGLDVSVKETSVCIVDETGKVGTASGVEELHLPL